MSSKHTASYFRTSQGAFETRCDYLWHRRFTSPEQREILRTSGAALVTYVVTHRMPFGRDTVTETTIMKVPLEMTNSTTQDISLLASVLAAFSPDGFEVVFEDDTYPEEQCVLCMWWDPHTARSQRNEPPASTETQCIISDDTEFSRVTSEFGAGTPVYIYGNGPWLISDRPLTEDHAKILLEVRK